MEPLYTKRATLIQNLAFFNNVVFQHIVNVFNKENNDKINIIDFYTWFIAELVGKHYGYNIIKKHNHNYPPHNFKMMFCDIQNLMNTSDYSLDSLFLHYIKGPALYINNPVRITFDANGNSLIFEFFTPVSETDKLFRKTANTY